MMLLLALAFGGVLLVCMRAAQVSSDHTQTTILHMQAPQVNSSLIQLQADLNDITFRKKADILHMRADQVNSNHTQALELDYRLSEFKVDENSRYKPSLFYLIKNTLPFG